MEKIIWEDKFATGYNPIDFQHKILIGIINDLIETSNNKKESGLWLDVVLEELKSYTKYHFSNEAVLMSKYGFDEIAEHAEQHADFIVKLGSFQRDFHLKGQQVSNDILEYLKNWLINHIVVEDKKLGAFLIEKEKGKQVNEFPFP